MFELSATRRFTQALPSAVAPVLLLALAGCDVISSSHDTREDAQLTIDKGWLPPAMPASATDIRERHDIDANSGVGEFDFAVEDAASFRANLQPVIAGSSKCHLPWESMKAAGREWFRDDNVFYLAVDWAANDVKFWLCDADQATGNS